MNEQRNDNTLAIIYLIMAAFLWSLGGVFIKWIQWHPIAIAGMKSAIAAIIIWLVLGKPKLQWDKDQILCALVYAITMILFVVSTKMTTAANAILLQYTAPIYVAIFGILILKEKTTVFDWIIVCSVLGGMILFFFDDFDTKSFWGNITAVLNGMSFAALMILSRKQKDATPLKAILLGNIITAVIGIPFMVQSIPTSSGWLGLFLLGSIQCAAPYILYSKAIKTVTALEAVIISVFEPILNPLWVFILLGEVPGKWALLGGVFVITAVTAKCIHTAMPQKVVKAYDRT